MSSLSETTYRVEFFNSRNGAVLLAFLETHARDNPGYRLVSVVPDPYDNLMLCCIFERAPEVK